MDIVQEVTKTVTAVIETSTSKTVVAIKSDFDEKIASLQLKPKEQEDDLDDIYLKPVSSADELGELEKNSDAKKVVSFILIL